MLTDFEANPARLAALTDLTRVHEPTQGPVSQLGDSVHRRLNFITDSLMCREFCGGKCEETCPASLLPHGVNHTESSSHCWQF